MNLRNMAAAVTAALLALPTAAEAGGLRGSPTSMREQHAVAVERDLEFISDANEVQSLVGTGGLEEIQSNADFRLSRVSFPYALPEVKLFLERIGRQYREANGTQLVVTSLTRPTSSQPRNAHELSVHPAGMAVDFRVPARVAGRAWLESTLLQLENAALLDVTRERYPPHYHVAVFPAAYGAYAKRQIAAELEAEKASRARAALEAARIDAAVTAAPVKKVVAQDRLLTGTSVAFALALGVFAIPAALVIRRKKR